MLAHLTYGKPRDGFGGQELGWPGGWGATKILSFPHISTLAENRYVFSLKLHEAKIMPAKVLSAEKAMAPHSSTLAWKIPRTEEPVRLQSMGSLRVSRLSDFTFTFHFHALEKEMAAHSSVLAWRIPGRGSLVGCRLWGRTESERTEVT